MIKFASLLVAVPAIYAQNATFAAAQEADIFPTVVPELNVQVDLMVSYDQPAFDFQYCGVKTSVEGATFTLNNTGGTVHSTSALTRSFRDGNFFAYGPAITWNPASESTKYIAMVVDPLFILGADGPAASFGAYIQHMLITDITGSNISNITTGTTVNPYLGPSPPDNADHKYVFLVYEQPAGFALTSEQVATLKQRANFNLTTFVDEHSLGPAVGINWVYVPTDRFAKFALEALQFVTPGTYCSNTTAAPGTTNTTGTPTTAAPTNTTGTSTSTTAAPGTTNTTGTPTTAAPTNTTGTSTSSALKLNSPVFLAALTALLSACLF